MLTSPETRSVCANLHNTLHASPTRGLSVQELGNGNHRTGTSERGHVPSRGPGSKTVCPMNGHEAGLHSSSLQTLPACSLDLASAVSGAREEPWRWLLPCWVDMGTEACAVLIPVAQAPAAP